MSKYILQLEQSIEFDDETFCFENLTQVMDALIEEGYRMTRIEHNNYYFENHDNGKKAVLRVLKGKAK